jgi:tripartite-type tricarboxylate transporter receptor subunit TctC
VKLRAIATIGASASDKLTPILTVKKLNTALNKVLVEVKAQLQEQGVEPGGSKPEDVKTRTIQELAKWKDVVAKSGPK